MVSLAHICYFCCWEIWIVGYNKKGPQRADGKRTTLSLKTWVIKIIIFLHSPFPYPEVNGVMSLSCVRELLLILVVNLLLPDRWSSARLIPRQLILIIQSGVFIRDRNHTTGVPHFLSADAHRITRNPE